VTSAQRTDRVAFDALAAADLHVDAVYERGPSGSMAHDPLARLLPCGNRGGFRFRGSRRGHDYQMAVLYSSGDDPDWPDALDLETGRFTYFGDNKRPGSELHRTPRGGNELLRFAFESTHSDAQSRGRVPPFFVFRRSGAGAHIEFVGLAVPGAKGVRANDDLVAVWRTTRDRRFQNYRAVFTILDVPVVSRTWIDELTVGVRLGRACPDVYRRWVEDGIYSPLEAPRTADFRSVDDQRPREGDRQLLEEVINHYASDPYGFELCAMELWRMLARDSVTSMTGTRRSADGGRDAVGLYSIGPPGDRVHLDFSLEAKCYGASNGVGVRDAARLISRLRHRQFGVLVTTSYVGPQAYREIREDGHPVVILCGRDIGELLRAQGISSVDEVRQWLRTVDGR
jgi:Restriction endonuclease AspBHI N-terminal/Restriction endonuclease